MGDICRHGICEDFESYFVCFLVQFLNLLLAIWVCFLRHRCIDAFTRWVEMDHSHAKIFPFLDFNFLDLVFTNDFALQWLCCLRRCPLRLASWGWHLAGSAWGLARLRGGGCVEHQNVLSYTFGRIKSRCWVENHIFNLLFVHHFCSLHLGQALGFISHKWVR